MDEGERRALIQSTRHGVRMIQESISTNRRMAAAYRGRGLGAAELPAELLAEYEQALRDSAVSEVELADALRGELQLRAA